jgi:hypothetical protein
VNDGDLNISLSIISSSSNYGIYDDGSTEITDSIITDNDYGIYTENDDTVITNNTIYNNATYGVYYDALFIERVEAEHNYWGDPTGPNHPANPDGEGQIVADDVDISPFRIDWVCTNWRCLISSDPDIHDSVEEGSPDELRWTIDDPDFDFISPWLDAVDIWDIENGVVISSNSLDPTLYISDISSNSVDWLAIYSPTSHSIHFEEGNMGGSNANQKINAAAHELGHALGLGHSYLSNLLYWFITELTSLGPQDQADYDFLWK